MNNAQTLQQIFDKVATHLITQGKAAKDTSGNCRYRTEEGLSCAVGCLISDEVYTPQIEDNSIWGIRHGNFDDGRKALVEALKESGLPQPTWDLLQGLQDIHDDHSPSQWRPRLQALAVEHNLDTRPLNEIPAGPAEKTA